MAPKIINVDPAAFDQADLQPAVDKILAGELVAFPTETVYGLGANALDGDAVRHIYQVKGRPPGNPLIVHVSSIEQAKSVTSEWPEVAQQMAEQFWPGPLTMVLPKADSVPDIVTAGLDTVAVRFPAHPIARALIEMAGTPLAAPSANRYTGISPTTAQHVIRSLGDQLDMVIDGGPTDVGLESTVVSLVGPPHVLRPGMVDLDDLSEVAAVEPHNDRLYVEDEAAASPGMARKHYAPSARVVITSPSMRQVLNTKLVGILRLAGGPPILDAFVIDMPSDPDGYARQLYDALHRCDEQGCEYIVIEPPPKNTRWDAIWNRIRRAASSEESSE